MPVILCSPALTMDAPDAAAPFYEACRGLLEQYLNDTRCLVTEGQVRLAAYGRAETADILVYFTSETGGYSDSFLHLLRTFCAGGSRIWGVAMDARPECRRPPEPVAKRQTFDVPSRLENRSPYCGSLRAVAQLFARKLVSQMLPPLYCEDALYFISHRRSDGEALAARLADRWRLLVRERQVYRDVTSVEVGTDAQEDIDEKLAASDVLIFLQTAQACQSAYIMKELCYALTHGIPVLWVQIDSAPYDSLKIRPGEAPLLRYAADDFADNARLDQIINELEEACFQLRMNCSYQVFSELERLSGLARTKKVEFVPAGGAVLGFSVRFALETRDAYDPGFRRHYVQCFGRGLHGRDREAFCRSLQGSPAYGQNDRLFLMSPHGRRRQLDTAGKLLEENYEDYIENIRNAVQETRGRKNQRVILSGAYPDCDEIYQNSFLEALAAYTKQIIKSGYTLVFGAHPTFQEMVFDIAARYSDDMRGAVEMHMDRAYLGGYGRAELEKKCTLVLSDGLPAMRERMICGGPAALMVCIGGKIKAEKSQQGVDAEIALARRAGIPVALAGTTGGRSSQYAQALREAGGWDRLNPWGAALNEALSHSVNHRLMAERLLTRIQEGV